MKKWEIKYADSVISVENRITGERLYVDGALQDERIGLSTQSRLWGRLHSGQVVKVSIGGIFVLRCRIFVDNKLVLAE